MRTRVITAIMIALFLASITPITVPVSATPTKRRVPEDYATIQAAINHANPGDTIKVHKGTYQETVTINSDDHDLKLKGVEHPTIMDTPGGSLLYGIDIRGGAYNIEISGFEIKGFDEVDDAAIFGRRGVPMSNIVIHHNIIHDNYKGIDIGARAGLFPPGHTKLCISENEIFMNNDIGVYLLRVSDSTIYNNTICQNTVGVSLRMVSDLTVNHNEILGNNRFGMRWAYVDNTEASHNRIEGSGNDGFRIVGTSTGNTIAHNKILSNTNNGIHLMDSTKNNEFRHNHALDNGDGISTKDIWCENGVGPNVWTKNKYTTATLLL